MAEDFFREASLRLAADLTETREGYETALADAVTYRAMVQVALDLAHQRDAECERLRRLNQQHLDSIHLLIHGTPRDGYGQSTGNTSDGE